MKRKADITMADNKRKATKNEKMSMKENERLLIEKFKTIKPVEKSYKNRQKDDGKQLQNHCSA